MRLCCSGWIDVGWSLTSPEKGDSLTRTSPKKEGLTVLLLLCFEGKFLLNGAERWSLVERACVITSPGLFWGKHFETGTGVLSQYVTSALLMWTTAGKIAMFGSVDNSLLKFDEIPWLSLRPMSCPIKMFLWFWVLLCWDCLCKWLTFSPVTGLITLGGGSDEDKDEAPSDCTVLPRAQTLVVAVLVLFDEPFPQDCTLFENVGTILVAGVDGEVELHVADPLCSVLSTWLLVNRGTKGVSEER